MKKTLSFLILAVVLFTVYCFVPNSPNTELIDKMEQIRLKYAKENFSDSYSILIDYNQPIFKKRLWVIDNMTNEVVLNSFISQAKNSGLIYAYDFSNVSNSKKSSVGVFKTLGSYESNYGEGEYKLGMRIKGLEKGMNDNVLKRNIVFHSSYGLWSEGCFMTSPQTNKKIIELTKNGCLLYVHCD